MSDNKPAPPMSKLDSAAVLLMSLGEADAAAILKHMGPKEVQRVGAAMANLGNVSQQQVENVVQTFASDVGTLTGLGMGAPVLSSLLPRQLAMRAHRWGKIIVVGWMK